jgi:hypothetical protein
MAAMSPRAEVIVTMAPAPAAVCAPMSAVVIDPGAIVAMAFDSISAGMSARISELKVGARRRGLQREQESGKRDRRRGDFLYSHSGLSYWIAPKTLAIDQTSLRRIRLAAET